ncbi:unnamed protein product [Closterium sp. NIES-54]
MKASHIPLESTHLKQTSIQVSASFVIGADRDGVLNTGAAQRDYELHSLEFRTAFLQGSVHEEIWLRRPPGFTGSFPAGTQWSLRRPVYGLRQAPREWHDTLRTTLAALGFAPSTSDPSLFLRTDTTLPPFYVLVYVDDLVFATADTEALAHVKSELQKRHTCTDLGELTSYLGLRITRDRAQCTITLTQSHMVQQVLQRFGFTYSSPQSTPLPTGHSLSAPPSDESIEPSGPTSGMGLVLGGRARVVLTGHADASWVDDLATQRSSQGYTFSLGSGSVSWRSARSSSVLSSSCEAEIYTGAMAAQELRWLTYLLTDLGEAPRSPLVLYVDNKAMLALCQEHRLEHRTKHIALRYFLARELQQRGQLCLAYVASQANTANVFTKALQPCDHQRFCTVLGLLLSAILQRTSCPPGWQFYHPTSRCVLSSQDVTFDESVSYYRLFPYHTASLHPPAALPCPRSESCASESWGSESWGSEVWGSGAWASESWGSGVWENESWGSEAWGSGAWASESWGSSWTQLSMELAEPSQMDSVWTPPSWDSTFPQMDSSPPPLFLAPGTPQVDPLPPQGPAPSGVSQVDPAKPVEVAVDSGAARGAETAGAGTRGAEPGGAEQEGVGSGGAEPAGAGTGGVESGGAESWGAKPTRAKSGGSPGVPLRREPLSLKRLREWYARRCRHAIGSAGAGAAGGAAGAGAARGDAGAGAAGGAAGARATRGAASAGFAGGAVGAGAAGGAAGAGAAGGAAGAGAAGPRGARTGGTGAAGAGGAAGVGAAGTRACGAAGVVAKEPGTEGTGDVSAVPGGAARLRPYYVLLPQQVLGLQPSRGPTPPLLSPPPVQSHSQLQPASPLPGPSPYFGPTRGLTEPREPESRPVSPESRPESPESRSESPVCTVRAGRCVTRPRPTPVPGTHSKTLRPSTAPQRVPLPSPPASSLPDGPDPESDSLRAASPTITRFLATGVNDPLFESIAASALVAELVDRQEEFECFAASVPHLAAMDAEMASWKSTGTYVDEVPPPGANIVSGMWIFRVKRPPGSPPIFKARYVARGFNDLVFATADTEALAHVKSELQKRHTCTDLGELTSYLGLRNTRDRAQRTITLTQSHMVQQVLQRFGFTCSSPQSTPLPTGHSLSAPPSDESVELSGPYPELVGCLMYLMTCTRPDLAYPLSLLARYVAPGRHRKVHWDAAKRVLRYLCSTSGTGLVLGGWAQVVLTSHADASWELRWLTYLLSDLGEAPRSPPVLYVNNKAMLALCEEHRLEHRTKHIALSYFLARELQQRGQLCLAYVASQANTTDVFTKALQPCDHQRFCTVLGLVPTVPHLLTS